MSLASIQLILLSLIFLAALFYSGLPERYVAGSFLFAMVLDRIAHAVPFIAANLNFAVWHLILDVLLMFALAGIAIKADRFWPMFVVSAQLIALIALALQAIGLGSQPLVWAVLSQAPTWLAIALTLFGILYRLRVQRTVQEH